MLREDGDAVLCIGQASHAWVSGQLARRWGNEAFPAPDPWEEVVLAADQHDVGMSEWDLQPSLNPRTGRPTSFTEMPLAEHVSLWSRAAGKLLTQSRYAALLVSMHGVALYERRDVQRMTGGERTLVERFLADQRALHQRLILELGLQDGQVARNQRLIWNWDLLSLAMCVPWCPSGGELTLQAVPGSRGPVDIRVRGLDPLRFTLAPWPFEAEEVEVRCEGRRLEGRHRTQASLHEALEHATVQELRFTLEREG